MGPVCRTTSSEGEGHRNRSIFEENGRKRRVNFAEEEPVQEREVKRQRMEEVCCPKVGQTSFFSRTASKHWSISLNLFFCFDNLFLYFVLFSISISLCLHCMCECISIHRSQKVVKLVITSIPILSMLRVILTRLVHSLKQCVLYIIGALMTGLWDKLVHVHVSVNIHKVGLETYGWSGGCGN